jgi:hypothetical protein
MNSTKGQKTMLAFFLAVVALLIVLWVTGVFKGEGKGSGFRNNNRSGLKFGRVTNRSSFGAIGAPTYNNSLSTLGPARFDIKYTNPALFGTLGTTITIESVWNGLLLSMSTATATDLANQTNINSTPNPETATVALAESNPFYQNRYLDALKNYYGSNYNPSEEYSPNNEDYNAFYALSNDAKAALQSVLNKVLSSTLSDVDLNTITFDSVFELTNTEISRLRTEIGRLIRFISTFRSSPSFNPNTPNTNNYAGTPSSQGGALEGVYVRRDGGTMGVIRESVSLITVKQTSWLDLTPGAYKFGVGIINSNLTIGTGDQYIFPFMVSDMIESVTGLGRTTTSNSPTNLIVSATYWP